MKGRLRIRSLLLAAFCSATPAWANVPEGVINELQQEMQHVRKAFDVEVTREGFASVSRELSAHAAKTPISQAVPDQTWEIPLIASVKARNLSASLRVSQLDISPVHDGLRLKFNVQDAAINLGALAIDQKLVPFLHTDCRNTQLQVSVGSPLAVSAEMGLAVDAQGAIRIRDPRIDFSISKHQYKVNGPAHCTGAFGIRDYVSQFVLNRLFTHTRGLVEWVLKNEIGKVLPTIEQELNKRVALTYPLSIPNLFVIPPIVLGVQLKPETLSITPERLKAQTGIGLVSQYQSLQEFHHSVESDGVLLGRVGVRYELINTVVGILLKHGHKEMQLSPQLHEVFATLLSVDELKEIWPDLASFPREENYLQAFISMPQAPKLIPGSQADNSLVVHIPEIALRWQVKRKGEWQNYFFTSIRVDLTIGARIAQGGLSVTRFEPRIAVKGRWAADYQPANQVFEEELFTEILHLGTSAMQGALLQKVLPIPRVPMGGDLMEVDGLDLVGEYARFALVGRKK